MKKIMLLLMFTLPAKAVVINPQLIDGFAYIESNFNDKAIGKAGEKGAWQFGKAAWADCNAERIKMGKPVYHWSKAHDRRIASDYAHLYTLPDPRQIMEGVESRTVRGRTLRCLQLRSEWIRKSL